VGRIVEISSDGHTLRIERGFLVVSKKADVIQTSKVPLDEIEALVINSQATSLTSSVHTSLADRGSPILFCDSRHLPISLALPLSRNYEHSKRVRQQARMTENTADRVWAQIVRSKVLRQAEVLEHFKRSGLQLRRIAEKVVDGDPKNCEAEAAKVY
jgi:CRISP-associated protein Cas1